MTVSEQEHSDLFWAVRGAAPNFGVVTGMRLKLFDAPSKVIVGTIVAPLKEAISLLEVLRDTSVKYQQDRAIQCSVSFTVHPQLGVGFLLFPT